MDPLFTINANIFTIDEPTRARVTALEQDVQRLHAQETIQMSLNDDLKTRMSKVDAATTEIANDLKALREKIASGEFVSPADKAQMLSDLDDRIKTLEDMGKDPA